MKKTYINPEMTVVTLTPQGCLLIVSGDVHSLESGSEKVDFVEDGIDELMDDV